MHHLDLTSWNDRDTGRLERGIERAADTIAMVLNWRSGSTKNAEFVHRLCGYEILTGEALPDTVPVDCKDDGASSPTDLIDA
jgi:hypothetical protein